MINKKNVLGKSPSELGVKDAIHVAIVSVRAGKPVQPGERCKLNEFREAVPDSKGVGVADPWRGPFATGDSFWLLVNQDEVPNVAHVWEHPSVDFSPPTRKLKRNSIIEDCANNFGVTYEQLMKACSLVVDKDSPAPYPGSKSAGEIKDFYSDNRYDLWSQWADESGYEFENHGSSCCPEYDYPNVLFEV